MNKTNNISKGVKMDKVVIFLDYANVNCASNDESCEINYPELLNYLANRKEGRFLQEAFAYVPIDPRAEHARDNAIQELWSNGFVVKTKVGSIAGNSYKCDFDVEMAMDMENVAHDINPDIIILLSGDSDFIPVVLDLRNKGIRVEVASFGCSMSSLLRSRCSGFIDLDRVVDYVEDFDALDELLNNNNISNEILNNEENCENNNDEKVEAEVEVVDINEENDEGHSSSSNKKDNNNKKEKSN